MVPNTDEDDLQLSRRKLLATAGLYGAGATAVSLLLARPAGAAPAPVSLVAPPVAGLHLQFGADASSEVTVSWHALEAVQNPRVMLGDHKGNFERTVAANVPVGLGGSALELLEPGGHQVAVELRMEPHARGIQRQAIVGADRVERPPQ